MSTTRARVARALALSLLSIPLAACAGATGAGHAAHARAAGFPTTVAAADGPVRIAEQPHRIVSLSASATEDLYAIGAASQVAAVDAYSTYPPQAPRTRLTETTASAEAVAAYHPDLVVIAEDTNHIDAQLHRLGIPVLLEPAPANLAGAYSEIEQLGQATGHSAQAARVAKRIAAEIAAIVRSTPRPRRALRVYHELEPTLFSATSHTFIGQIYSLFGLQNIADSAHGAGPYPQLSDEFIIAANPNLIVLADTVCCKQSAATVAARAGWRNIAAVKDGAIVPVNDSIASQWGPRIVLFVEKIAAAVRSLQAREHS